MNNDALVHVPRKQTQKLFGINSMFTLKRLCQDILSYFVLNG